MRLMIRSVLRGCIFCSFLLLPVVALCQVKFVNAQLQEPVKYGPQIGASLKTTELPEYIISKDDKNRVYLKTGLRTSKIENTIEWLRIKDTVDPYRIDLVYSKYPFRDGQYKEIYPLLCNRLLDLFQMDSRLNDVRLDWNKILQTNCTSDVQVSRLFHGVVICYHTRKKAIPHPNPAKKSQVKEVKQEAIIIPQDKEVQAEQTSFKDIEYSLNNIKNASSFPDSIKRVIDKKPLGEQLEIIKGFLESKIAKEPEITLSSSSKAELNMYEHEIDYFLMNYNESDDVVAKVLDRHSEWKNILVVNDWTGSMYGYGAQVLRWHLLNFKKSGIKSLTLFNDGDDKSTINKVIGETGGIYSEKADNILKLVDLFNLIMLKGGGGDGPENDIEAILEAMDRFSDYSEVVLIADNNSCVRDIELADRIDKPVKVILCGYDPRKGINPDYVYLAKITNGGIYTVDEDLENIATATDEKGKLVNFTDKRFRLRSLRCLNSGSDKRSELYTDLKKANQDKLIVERLDLSNKNLIEIPKGIYKMKNISYLNLNNNNIAEISSKINQLKFLKTLNLANNSITNVPDEMIEIRYLTSLNLSHNNLSQCPSAILNMKVLTSLNLSDNKINTIFRDNSLRKLEYLNLSNNAIVEIPKSFGLMKKLQALDLSGNKIEVLPAEITNLVKLEELKLENNRLSSLPQQIGKLSKLKTLKLKGNNLKEEEKTRIKNALPATMIIF
jgi:hypothetical protein